MKKYLRNSELQKLLEFEFHYWDEPKAIRTKCSILKAMEYFRRSPSADLFIARCSNCTIYIDGSNKDKDAAAYLAFKNGPEFIVAATDNLEFEDGPVIFGTDVHIGKTMLSPEFKIIK